MLTPDDVAITRGEAAQVPVTMVIGAWVVHGRWDVRVLCRLDRTKPIKLPSDLQAHSSHLSIARVGGCRAFARVGVDAD